MTNTREKFYFTKEQLENTPSRQRGIESAEETVCRQQAANFIYGMGRNLKLNTLCINTAIVYMHQFYMYHPFTVFAWESLAVAALFLASKVEEQRLRLAALISIAKGTLSRYPFQLQELLLDENALLATLGPVNLTVELPHQHILLCSQRFNLDRERIDLFCALANKILRLSTFHLMYKPSVLACFTIYFTYKYHGWEIPRCDEDRYWFLRIDENVTTDFLNTLIQPYLRVYNMFVCRKRKATGNQPPPGPSGTQNEPGPSGTQNGPGPSGIQNEPGPSGIQNEPGPSGIQNKPGPSGIQNEPGPSGTQPKHNRQKEPTWNKVPKPMGRLDKSHLPCTVTSKHVSSQAQPPPNLRAEPTHSLQTTTTFKVPKPMGLLDKSHLPCTVTSKHGPSQAQPPPNLQAEPTHSLQTTTTFKVPKPMGRLDKSHLPCTVTSKHVPSQAQPPPNPPAEPTCSRQTTRTISLQKYRETRQGRFSNSALPDKTPLQGCDKSVALQEGKSIPQGAGNSGEKAGGNHLQLSRPMYSMETSSSIINSVLKEVPDLPGIWGLATGFQESTDSKHPKKHENDRKRKRGDMKKSPESTDRKDKYVVQDQVDCTFEGEAGHPGISGEPTEIAASKKKVR